MRRFLSLVVLALVGALALVLWRPALNPFTPAEEPASRTVLESLTDMSEFHAVSGYYETVVLLEDDSRVPDFLTGDRLVYVGKGSVDVAVDFGGLDENAITTTADRTAATIRLPDPVLSKPSLDLEESKVFTHERGLITKFKGSDRERKAQIKAVEQITTAASAEDKLVEQAKKNTTAVLDDLLGGLGYTDVTVLWGVASADGE